MYCCPMSTYIYIYVCKNTYESHFRTGQKQKINEKSGTNGDWTDSQKNWAGHWSMIHQISLYTDELNFSVWINLQSLISFSMNDFECLKIQMGSELITMPCFLVDKFFSPIQSRWGLHSGLLAVLRECWAAPISWKFVIQNIWWILECTECIRMKSEFICK